MIWALSFESFVNLPADICLAVMSVWILPEDLSHFDSSICNITLRRQFLLLIASKSFSITGSNSLFRNKKNEMFNKWIADRSIKVKSLCLTGSRQTSHSSSSHCLEQIRKLEFLFWNEFVVCASDIASIINRTFSLKHLTFCDVLSLGEVFKNIQPKQLTEIRKLKILFLAHREPIYDHVVECIADFCTHLVYLDICDNHHIESSGYVAYLVRILNANPNLLCVYLQNASMDDSILRVIRKTCRNVQQVHLIGSSRLTLDETINTRDSCSFLSSFYLKSLSIPQLVDVVGCFRTVKLNDKCQVQISHGISLSSTSLNRVTKIPITKLTFSHVSLTSDTITSIARNSPQLELLCIDRCGELFSVQSMLELAAKCMSLSLLHLGSCNQFIPQDFIALFTECRLTLKVVSIAHHSLITRRDAQQIANICEKLEVLCISGDCELVPPYYNQEFLCCTEDVCNCQRIMPVSQGFFDKKMFVDFFDEDKVFPMETEF
jgi:hypothetical protein